MLERVAFEKATWVSFWYTLGKWPTVSGLESRFLRKCRKGGENAWSLAMHFLVVPNEELKNNSNGDRLLPPTIHAFESPLPGGKMTLPNC